MADFTGISPEGRPYSQAYNGGHYQSNHCVCCGEEPPVVEPCLCGTFEVPCGVTVESGHALLPASINLCPVSDDPASVCEWESGVVLRGRARRGTARGSQTSDGWHEAALRVRWDFGSRTLSFTWSASFGNLGFPFQVSYDVPIMNNGGTGERTWELDQPITCTRKAGFEDPVQWSPPLATTNAHNWCLWKGLTDFTSIDEAEKLLYKNENEWSYLGPGLRDWSYQTADDPECIPGSDWTPPDYDGFTDTYLMHQSTYYDGVTGLPDTVTITPRCATQPDGCFEDWSDNQIQCADTVAETPSCPATDVRWPAEAIVLNNQDAAAGTHWWSIEDETVCVDPCEPQPQPRTAPYLGFTPAPGRTRTASCWGKIDNTQGAQAAAAGCGPCMNGLTRK